MIKRAPLEIPPAIARQFMADLQAHYAEVDPVKRDEIASRQLYGTAALPVHILKQCGDDLTRANIMKQATNIKGYVADLALPGMTNSTTAPLRSRRSRRPGRCLVRPARPNNRSR